MHCLSSKFFTFLPQDVVEALENSVEQEPHLREAQKKLAWEMTTMIHGEQEAEKAIFAAAALFGREDIREVDAVTMEALHNATEAPSFSSLDVCKLSKTPPTPFTKSAAPELNILPNTPIFSNLRLYHIQL